MARARYVSNSRHLVPGTRIEGNIIHEQIEGMDIGLPDVTSTSEEYPIGTRLITADGRVFRYCLSAGAVQAGRGCKTIATITDDGIAANTSKAEAVGATDVSFASQTFALNELRGGYLVIYSATSSISKDILLVILLLLMQIVLYILMHH